MNLLWYAILSLIVILLLGVTNLVIEEMTTGNACPLLLRVPACYIVLVCGLLVTISHFKILNDRHSLYFIGAGIAFLIALVASVLEISGFSLCPKTSNGIPMCYLSLLVFSSLLILKAFEIKYQGQ